MLKMPKIPKASGGRGGLARLRELVEAVTYRQWLILAGLFSVLMGIVVYVALTGRSDAPVAVLPETRKAVVATVDIQERTVIEPDMLEVVDYPADFLPAGAISDPAMAVGQAAGVTMQAGDVVTSKKLLDDPALAGFTGAIPPDMRAISVAISDAAGISGFAKPGDYVDVIAVRTDKGGAAGSGELLLQNVLLLGVNKAGITAKQQKASEAEAKGSESIADQAVRGTQAASGGDASVASATLALTPADALRLSVNAQNATIYLILRPYRPASAYVETPAYYMPGARQAAPVPAAAQAPVPEPGPAPEPAPAPASAPAPVQENTFGIEIIRGKGAPEAQPAAQK